MHAKSVARARAHALIVESTFKGDEFVHHSANPHLLNGQALKSFARANKSSKTQKHKRFWCISIAIHLIILALIMHFGVMHKRSEESGTVLKSYLIVPLNTLKATNLTPESTALIELESDDLKIETPLDPDPKPNPDINLQSETLKIINEPAQANKSSELTAPANTELNRVFTNRKVDISMSERLKRALLQQANESAAQALVKEAAKQHQKAKLSPEINTVTSVNTWDIPDEASKTEVDCTNALKQSLAIVSMLARGTIKCRDKSNFQEYIDERIEKNP